MGSTQAPTIVVCGSCETKNRVPASGAGTPRCGTCQAALPWMAEANDVTFHDVVEESRLPVLVDLWAPWCGPCRMVSPALENLTRQFAGRIKLVKVNVDESPAIQQRFAVMGIPTLLVVHHGEVLARQTGAAPERHLRQWLESSLPASA